MMSINLLAIGTRMPNWVKQGYEHYTQLLTQNCRINLIEIAAKKRSKSVDLTQIIAQESKQLLAAVPTNNITIALERTGRVLDSPMFAQKLSDWQLLGVGISFLVGGPEGLSAHCCQQADTVWSLSALTLPHPLVRIVLVEQLYRAFSILHNHPYHR